MLHFRDLFILPVSAVPLAELAGQPGDGGPACASRRGWQGCRGPAGGARQTPRRGHAPSSRVLFPRRSGQCHRQRPGSGWGGAPAAWTAPGFSLGAKAERRTPESSEADAAPAAPRGAVACWRALSPWSLGSGCEETPPLGVTRRRLRHTYFLPCRSCRRSCRNPRKGEGPAGATPAAASPAARPTATSREPIPGCPKICKNTSIYFIFFVLRQDVYIKLRF